MATHYLDNSATTPLCDKAKNAIAAYMDTCFGNPSSMHLLGAQALVKLDAARDIIARAVGCQAKELYFTSCGSEANNTAVFGAVRAKRREGNHLVTTAIEHPSVLNCFKQLEKDGFSVTYIKPDSDGNISEQSVRDAVRADTILVSMMYVNNETGAILPVSSIKPSLKAVGSSALIHSDCVQAFGKLPIRPATLGADLVTVSGHKLHAPKGIGALYLSQNARILPLIYGGGQEKGLRSGTEATLLIEGFAAAVSDLGSVKDNLEKLLTLCKNARERLSALDGVVINSPENALPYILNFSVEGIRSEIMMHHLEAREIYVSSGSACAKGGVSHVLSAQGLSRSRADSAIRASFSRFTDKGDIDALIDAVSQGVSTLKRRK